MEVSVVAFPAQPEATMDFIKSARDNVRTRKSPCGERVLSE